MLKKISPAISFALVALLMTGCSAGDNSPSQALPKTTDSTGTSTDAGKANEKYTMKAGRIRYQGAADDTVKRALQTFMPMAELLKLASLDLHVKDSIKISHNAYEIKDGKDSLVFMPYDNMAYKALLAYRQMMATRPPTLSKPASLLALNRLADAEDSSFTFLPQPGRSDFFSKGSFFFLGAAPFASKVEAEDKTVYTDAKGNPELRFECNLTENTAYLFNTAYHLNKGPVKVLFGPPLRSYDLGPQDVHGIGTLVHEFTERIPVFFLTENGLVHGELVSVGLKLMREDLGCVSDDPNIIFSTARHLTEKDILGIYIPGDKIPAGFKINRASNHLWTADLDNDGIDDLACVSDTFEGITGDVMAELIWYANINGSWKIIDWGRQPDCT